MNYDTLLARAHEAASAAQVGLSSHPFNCGFAWVKIDGNSPLARHCRRQHKIFPETFASRRFYGSKSEPGWQWWGPGDYAGQDMDVKLAGARAFVDELAKAGIRADIGSRLD